MFFENDSSSGVSGDLESATAVASFMEGFWGMGSTVSSYSMAKRLEVGSPGGGAGGRKQKGKDHEAEMRRALADRIEDNLGSLLQKVDELLAEDRASVLCLAHALETFKTLNGDDVIAVIERSQGPVVDGTLYAVPGFVAQIEVYHRAAMVAHQEHSMAALRMPELPSRVLVGAVAGPPAPAPAPLPPGNGAYPYGSPADGAAPGPAGPGGPAASGPYGNGSAPGSGSGPDGDAGGSGGGNGSAGNGSGAPPGAPSGGPGPAGGS
jgi:hypothetical protein